MRALDLSKISEEELLSLRICDLPLDIENSWLANCLKELYQELEAKEVQFKPPCYLADEWLTPDKEPVVGVPFFLAHPALIKLERKMMLDVEGGTHSWCMKLLRHETGHALNYAYKLYRRKKWQKTFGQFSKEYNDTYRWRPYSRSFVRHLEDYYAQYHPDEDFAETFAVWLTPGLNWQEQYKGWKALAKLNYVNELMSEVKDKEPRIQKGTKYWQASSTRATLKNFYKKKRHFYAEDFPDFHDANLKRIFISKDTDTQKDKVLWAGNIIRKHKRNILNNTAKWTGEKKYIINNLLNTIIQRSKQLHLKAQEPESLAAQEVSIYVTALVMNYLHTGKFRKKDVL
ncbi:MAG: hypothetical protein ABIH08_06715 [Candidatus Omnitrophota bacterium]